MTTRRRRHAIHDRRAAREAAASERRRDEWDQLIYDTWLSGGDINELFACPCCAYLWAPVTEAEWRAELAEYRNSLEDA